jgi:hypothetical protein
LTKQNPKAYNSPINMARQETLHTPSVDEKIVAKEIKDLLATIILLPEFKKNPQLSTDNSFVAYIDKKETYYSVSYQNEEYGKDLSVLRFKTEEDGKKKFDASLDLSTTKALPYKARLNNQGNIVTGFRALNQMEEVFPEFFK